VGEGAAVGGVEVTEAALTHTVGTTQVWSGLERPERRAQARVVVVQCRALVQGA
jgi:hypothetical protein